MSYSTVALDAAHAENRNRDLVHRRNQIKRALQLVRERQEKTAKAELQERLRKRAAGRAATLERLQRQSSDEYHYSIAGRRTLRPLKLALGSRDPKRRALAPNMVREGMRRLADINIAMKGATA